LIRILRSLISVYRQVREIRSKADGLSNAAQFAFDLIRVKFGSRSRLADGLRTIRMADGTVISYRLNRGDLQSIREVWLDEEYRLPDEAAPFETLVDLGANIGLTSLWLAKKYGFRKLVAVEPSPENADIVRINLQNNGVNGIVIEAAAGPHDGTARFAASPESNQGRLSSDGDNGFNVSVVTMDSILRQGNIDGAIDVLKLDIEGGEEDLVQANLQWLSRVRRIVAELHPAIVDTDCVIAAFRDSGLEFIPGAGDHSGVSLMDTFVRNATLTNQTSERAA
jgi:FkbM family methyltransferase